MYLGRYIYIGVCLHLCCQKVFNINNTFINKSGSRFSTLILGMTAVKFTCPFYIITPESFPIFLKVEFGYKLNSCLG